MTTTQNELIPITFDEDENKDTDKDINTYQNCILYTKLHNYYSNNGMYEKLRFSLEKYSLRIIDWFITNYAPRRFTQYIIIDDHNGEERLFNVYENYKLNLKAYSKKSFDPFCRRNRIKVALPDNSTIETTLGQLNFFRWCFENKILEYINIHRDEIVDDINNHNITIKTRIKENNPKTKRVKAFTSTRKVFHRESIHTTFSIPRRTESQTLNNIVSHQIECI